MSHAPISQSPDSLERSLKNEDKLINAETGAVGAASGIAVGALAGAIAGPPGAIAGAVIGGGAKAAWFKDSEGNILALIEEAPESR